ncbi:MAG TPA: FAD-dependent oxidoreductase [Armatimonadota bacterium]|nr:FAD-dependent oxidoreductase [Armatimonadota bacterium]
MLDVIIIGGGPAGMTASIYAARKALDQVLISPDVGGQAAWASEIENYLGYSVISGFDLVERFEEHVKRFGVERLDDRVSTLRKHEKTFVVKTVGGREFESRAVIVASGRSARNLGVPGEEQFKGRGVSYCATCDAPLFAGEDVAVVGGGNAGLDAAAQLARICPAVYIIESDTRLTGDKKFQQRIRSARNVKLLLETEVTAIFGNKMVEGLSIHNAGTGEDRRLPVAGVFVEIGSLPNVDFLPPEVKINKHSEIVIDCGCNTSALGIFGAGDVTNIPNKQIIIAAGEGAKALLSANDYLIHH